MPWNKASTNHSYVIDLTIGDGTRARVKRFKKHHKPSLTQSDCSPTSPHLDQLASEHATLSSIGEELPSGSRGREVTGSSGGSKRLSEFISSKEQSDSNKESSSCLRSSQKLSLPEVTGVCSSAGLSAIANYIEDVESGESGGSVESGESDVDAEGESEWRDGGDGSCGARSGEGGRGVGDSGDEGDDEDDVHGGGDVSEVAGRGSGGRQHRSVVAGCEARRDRAGAGVGEAAEHHAAHAFRVGGVRVVEG